jgi:hypothetical protein
MAATVLKIGDALILLLSSYDVLFVDTSGDTLVKKLLLQVLGDVVDFGLSQEDPGRHPPPVPLPYAHHLQEC